MTRQKAAAGTEMTGSEIFVRSLIAEGVDVLFGYPGGSIIGIYDVLHDLSHIKHIRTRHEQAATHAAEGYAKATGKPGVVLVTSGPGATNAVTGICDALLDSVPIVVFSGQVSLHLIGNDAFQEADIVNITRPITKHNYLVRNVEELASTIKEAFYIATTGRPGPVLVDMPKDMMMQKTKFLYPESAFRRGYNPTTEGHIKQVQKAAEMMTAAKRPVLYVGGGVIQSNASLELKAIAEKLQAPVTMTLQGLGAFPESHKLSLGMLGMHGTWYANMAVHHADLLVAIGARFDDRVTGKVEAFAPEAKIIHIDIDPAAISKNVAVDLPIVGDVKAVLSKMIPFLGKGNLSEWLKTIDVWKKDHPLRYHRTAELSAQEVIQELSNATKGNAIVVTDVGQHQMWTAQFYKYMYPRTNITSGGLGTMGFSLPAAIGVSAARQDLPVISISGDGGFQMNMQEMGTILEYNLPVKIFIINNGFLGMVRQWQDLFWKKRYSAVEMKNPDFVKLADAYGCPAARVSSREQLGPAIKAALAHKGAYFVEFVVAMEDNVYPMIPAGQSVDEMMELPAELPTPSSIVVKG